MLFQDNPALWLFLRHMRKPMLTILTTYSMAAFILSIIPGIEVNGSTQYLSLFHSLYVISYTATTIGFGEIPFEFSNAQRVWMMVVIHITVVSWAYTITTILGILQNPVFQQIIRRRNFSQKVQAIGMPFYIICGYGETGSHLSKALIARGYGVVIIENKQERENELILQNFPIYVPHVCADASNIEVLKDGGIESRYCAGIFALTDEDLVNQRIMVVSQFIRHRLYTASRCDNSRMRAVLENANVDLVINVFDIFAERVRLAITRPNLYALIELLQTGVVNERTVIKGKWLVFGWGRFGSTLGKTMRKCGIEVIPIDVENRSLYGEKHGINTDKVDEDSMQKLIAESDGVVIASPNDPTNIALLLAARAAKKKISSIIRQNRANNDALFTQLKADLTMVHRNIIIDEIISNLTIPLLGKFFKLVEKEPEEWAENLLRLITRTIVKANTNLHVWNLEINKRKTIAIMKMFSENVKVELRYLLHLQESNSKNIYSDSQMYSFPLLIARQKKYFLAPSFDFELMPRDRILFVGHLNEEEWMVTTFKSLALTEQIIFGKEKSRSLVLNWLQKKLSK